MNTENILMEVLDDCEQVEYNLEEIERNFKAIKDTLSHFVKSVKTKCYEIEPLYIKYFFTARSEVALKKTLKLSMDVQVRLCARSVRSYITPDKSQVCFEVENKMPRVVTLREVFGAPIQNYNENGLYLTVGKQGNKAINCDLTTTPHILVAGATGSGKSVFVSQALLSLVARYSPEKLNLAIMDVKGVEYGAFKGLKHLINGKIKTSEEEIETTLENLVLEMERRYQLIAEAHVKNIQKYNEQTSASVPYIVVVIEEFAELMSCLPKKFTNNLQRLLQMGRGVGIHLILSSQRVYTLNKYPQIKALIPARVVLRLASVVDSLVVINTAEASKLIGRGDALYVTLKDGVTRVATPYVSYEEINAYKKELLD